MDKLPLALGEISIPAEDVLEELDRLKLGDSNWKSGRMPMYVFYANDALSDLAKKAFSSYFSENAHASKALPSISAMQTSVIHSALKLMNAPKGADGAFTSGGTESIFLAMSAARDRSRVTGRSAGAPNVIVPASCHPGFDKAAHYLGLKVIRVPTRLDWRADVSAMASAIDENTIAMVGSAPSFPHGLFDPIAELSEVAKDQDIWLHVDACVGGYLAPFLRHIGNQIPEFDFALDGVTSISADLHKYGFVPKPASTLLFRSREDALFSHFEFNDWPRGQYMSGTFSGTRPAGPIAASWAMMRSLGMSGYADLGREAMNVRDRLIAGLGRVDGLYVVGEPELTIFAYGAIGFDIHAVGDLLEKSGWFVARNSEPASLQFMAMPIHSEFVDEYLRDVEKAVREVRTTGLVGQGGKVTY